jgi:hypothetical protein
MGEHTYVTIRVRTCEHTGEHKMVSTRGARNQKIEHTCATARESTRASRVLKKEIGIPYGNMK